MAAPAQGTLRGVGMHRVSKLKVHSSSKVTLAKLRDRERHRGTAVSAVPPSLSPSEQLWEAVSTHVVPDK